MSASSTSGAVEYDCEGCGVHVFAFGITAPPAGRFCSVCDMLDDMRAQLTPDNFWLLHLRLREGPPA